MMYLWLITIHRAAIPLLDKTPLLARGIFLDRSRTSCTQSQRHIRKHLWSIRIVGTRFDSPGCCSDVSMNDETMHVAIVCGRFEGVIFFKASIAVVSPSESESLYCLHHHRRSAGAPNWIPSLGHLGCHAMFRYFPFQGIQHSPPPPEKRDPCTCAFCQEIFRSLHTERYNICITAT